MLSELERTKLVLLARAIVGSSPERWRAIVDDTLAESMGRGSRGYAWILFLLGNALAERLRSPSEVVARLREIEQAARTMAANLEWQLEETTHPQVGR